MWPLSYGRSSSEFGQIGKGTGKPSWQVKAQGGTGQRGVLDSLGLVGATLAPFHPVAPNPVHSVAIHPLVL